MAIARAYVDSVGSALAERAISLFKSLGSHTTGAFRLARAFKTVPLRGDSAPSGLCDDPRVGTSAFAGASDGHTRYYDWRFLGLMPVGYEQGSSAVWESDEDCQSPKRIAVDPFQKMIAGSHGFPVAAQLTVVRLGSMLLGAIPAEVTTTVGERMKAAMLREADVRGVEVDSVTLVSLTNGYLQYITTSEEYRAQRYEGGATIYGPASAPVFRQQLAGLVRELSTGKSGRSRPARVDSLVAFPGKPKSVFPSFTSGPPEAEIARVIERLECRGDALVIRWIDAYPGRLIPADGPVLRIDQETESGGWQSVVWDDDASLEVRALRAKGRRGYLWEAKWAPDGPERRYRFVLLSRPGLAEVTSRALRFCR